MPLSMLCSRGVLVLATSLVFLLAPVPYLAPGLFSTFNESPPPPAAPAAPAAAAPRGFTLDLFAACIMIVIFFYTLLLLSEWTQRKLIERRIFKLNQDLVESVERLRALDAQLEQLDSTLRLVHDAADEYSLLLYLLLRRRRRRAAAAAVK